MTKHDTLDESISMFNSIVRGRDPTLTLDLHVVDIRDAIAHGRIFTHHPSKPMQLFKYTKPKKVEVKLAVTNTPEWFANELKLVLQDIGIHHSQRSLWPQPDLQIRHDFAHWGP